MRTYRARARLETLRGELYRRVMGTPVREAVRGYLATGDADGLEWLRRRSPEVAGLVSWTEGLTDEQRRKLSRELADVVR